MPKRAVAFLLALFLAVLSPIYAFADETGVDLKLDEPLPEAVVVLSVSKESLPARSAILISQQSGQTLYEQNADEQLPPASVTKVMTLLLVMEAIERGDISLDDIVTASPNACSMGGSQIWLEPNEQMSVNDLVKAVAIASANDASVALGEHVAGTEQTFIDMMNARAEELGMVNTHFVNCTGLDATGHLTTSRDIAIMSRELIKHPLISEYSTIWMDSLRDGKNELVNTNKLVRFYPGATGLKTGTTSGAGSCLSATATREGLGLVAVVMGCNTSDERFASARGLLDYGFANYKATQPPAIDDKLVPVKVIHGVEDTVKLTYTPPGSFVVEKRSDDMITQEISIVPDVKAPVEVGQVLGKAQVIIDGVVVMEYDIKAAESVAKMNMPAAFGKLVNGLLTLHGRQKEEKELADDASDISINVQDDSSKAVDVPCKCGIDTCYCEEIGDICGCTE